MFAGLPNQSTLLTMVSACSFEFLFLFTLTIPTDDLGHNAKNIYLNRDGARENRLNSKTHTGTAKQWYLTTIIIYKQEHEIKKGFCNRKDN